MKTKKKWSLSGVFRYFQSSFCENYNSMSHSLRKRSFWSHSWQTRVNKWNENYCPHPKSGKLTAVLPSRLTAGLNEMLSQVQDAGFDKDQHLLPETSITGQIFPALRGDAVLSALVAAGQARLSWNSCSKASHSDTFCQLSHILKRSDKINHLIIWLLPMLIHAAWPTSVKLNSWWRFLAGKRSTQI